MRIRVDMDLCQGHGVCCEESPQVFVLKEGKVRVREAEAPEELRESVRLAVRYCPTAALSIEEE